MDPVSMQTGPVLPESIWQWIVGALFSAALAFIALIAKGNDRRITALEVGDTKLWEEITRRDREERARTESARLELKADLKAMKEEIIATVTRAASHGAD